MAYKAGSRQSFPDIVLSSVSLPIFVISNTLGAKWITIRSFSAQLSGAITLVATPGFFISTRATGFSYNVFPTSVVANTLIGATSHIVLNPTNVKFLNNIVTPYVHIYGSQVGASGLELCQFEAWPEFDYKHPNLGIGGGELPI